MTVATTEQLARFARYIQVDTATDCHDWTGYRDPDGYGQFHDHGHPVKAYRWAYKQMVGPIPPGFEVDHLCRNPACVNPAHLEPVTGEENRRRKYEAMTHCKNGHEFTSENTYRPPGSRRRHCRACQRVRSRKWKAKHRKGVLA